jgi:hypothetical protein
MSKKRTGTKIITIRVPRDLLAKMSAFRHKEGVGVTFQMCKGAEMYLKSKGW